MPGARVEAGRRASRLAVALACAALAACAPKADIAWPQGPLTPSASAIAAFDRAAAPCRAAASLSAEVSVSGRLGREKVRGRLLVGVDASGRLRVEALAPFGAPVFVLAAAGGRATLLLPREGRVVRDAPAGEVLDALAGLRVGAADLRALLAGCVAAGDAAEGFTVGASSVVVLDGRARAALRDQAGDPLIVAGEIDAPGAVLRVGYAEFAGDGRPRAIRVQRALSPAAVDLHLRLSQVDAAAPLGADLAEVRVPADARPMTLDELRRSSPLAAREP